MRRTASAGLLIICLGIFLCPQVGRQEALAGPVPAKKSSCCARKNACEEMSKRTSEHKGCAGEQSQNNVGCPVPCSALVLFCSPLEPFIGPAQTEHLLFASEARASSRTDRPPVPPPRV